MDNKSAKRWFIGILVSLSGIAISVAFGIVGVAFGVAGLVSSNAASESAETAHSELATNQNRILNVVSRPDTISDAPEIALTKPVMLLDVVTDPHGRQVVESFRDLFVNIGAGAKNISMQWTDVFAVTPNSQTKYYSTPADQPKYSTPMSLAPNDRAIMPELPNVFQSNIGSTIQTATGKLDVKYNGTDGKSYSKSYSAKFVRALDGGLVLYIAESENKTRRIASLDASDWF